MKKSLTNQKRILSSLIDNGFVVVGIEEDKIDIVEDYLESKFYDFLYCRGMFTSGKEILSYLIPDNHVSVVKDCVDMINKCGYDSILYKPPHNIDPYAYIIDKDSNIVHSYAKCSFEKPEDRFYTIIGLTNEVFSFYNGEDLH